MKTTIACKKQSAGVLSVILTLVGIGVLVSGSVAHSIPAILMGALITILCGVFAVQFLSLPSKIIVLTDDGTLLLPKSEAVSLRSINDVSYRRASSRGVQYRWGSVTISTYSGTYKYGFIADCEDVAKELTRLMHEAKEKR